MEESATPQPVQSELKSLTLVRTHNAKNISDSTLIAVHCVGGLLIFIAIILIVVLKGQSRADAIVASCANDSTKTSV